MFQLHITRPVVFINIHLSINKCHEQRRVRGKSQQKRAGPSARVGLLIRVLEINKKQYFVDNHM